MTPVRTTLSLLATAFATTLTTAIPARAYQIDCAILLCLAGGFPPSAPCAAAQAEMIRRITPWPIEPPLQLWRCPMRAESQSFPAIKIIPVGATFAVVPPPLSQPQSNSLERLWNTFGEEVSDYMMALKVYDLTYRRHYSSTDDSCNVTGRFRIGTYDAEGAFFWRRGQYSESPAWFLNTHNSSCSDLLFRAVGMEWLDYDGRRGTEMVPY